MSVEIHYYDDAPAWKILASDPARFKGVNYDLEIKLFRLPEGGLVGVWLRLYDVPDQPFFLHRVLDPSDATIGAYLDALGKTGKLMLIFESPGEQEGFVVELPVDSRGLREVLAGARSHNEALGETAHGENAVAEFLKIFSPALKEEKSVAAAWERVRQERPYVPPAPPPEAPAVSTWGGIVKLLLGAVLCIGGNFFFRSLTPLADNAALENKVVRPGYAVKIYLGKSLRSIGGRWSGEAPVFTVEEGEQSFIDSVKTHSDSWEGRLTEMHERKSDPPAFRPYIEVRLKDTPDLSGKTLNGTASLRGVYPVFSGVVYKEMSGTWSKKVSFTVFTFPQFLLARAAPVLLTAGIFLVVLTLLAVYGRLKEESNPDE
ncbi:MAG: hypothetical protein ABIJ96_00765 [Elusimicrobiota bacterium]